MVRELSYEDVAVELIRGLRGRRSQVAFSKRLGYRSNIVHRWEARQCWPVAAVLLRRCRRVGIDVNAAYERFYGRRPAWLRQGDPNVAAFLDDLRGKVPIRDLAAKVGVNRYTVARWLNGQAQPRLPDFLALIDASSRRLLDFIAGLVDPARMPALARDWSNLERARETAYATPWSHGVLHALELEGDTQDSAWLSRKLGIARDTVEDALAALQLTGQVEPHGKRLRPTRSGYVDTSRDPERARELKMRWTETALERLRAGSAGLFGYAVFAVSKRDLRRLREIQLQYVSQIQTVIAGSQRPDCVGLFCTQLLDLAEGEENALAGAASTRELGG